MKTYNIFPWFDRIATGRTYLAVQESKTSLRSQSPNKHMGHLEMKWISRVIGCKSLKLLTSHETQLLPEFKTKIDRYFWTKVHQQTRGQLLPLRHQVLSLTRVLFDSPPPNTDIGLCWRNRCATMLRTIYCTLYLPLFSICCTWDWTDCIYVEYNWSVWIACMTNLFIVQLIINLNQ